MAANATRPGMFGSMSKGGFMAGLLGAGALGLLLGYGLSGGLGGLGAIARPDAADTALRGRSHASVLVVAAPQAAAGARLCASGRFGRRLWSASGHGPRRITGWRAAGAAVLRGPDRALARWVLAQQARPAACSVGGAAQAEQTPTRPLTVAGDDFSAFERLLQDIHAAFAREDQTALRQLCTEEMADYFVQDIAENVRENRAVRIANVKLEQGDLSEAWKEPGAEYATVAMRFSLEDQLLDRRTQQVLPESNQGRSEITEIWTFVRPARRAPAGLASLGSARRGLTASPDTRKTRPDRVTGHNKSGHMQGMHRPLRTAEGVLLFRCDCKPLAWPLRPCCKQKGPGAEFK